MPGRGIPDIGMPVVAANWTLGMVSPLLGQALLLGIVLPAPGQAIVGIVLPKPGQALLVGIVLPALAY